MTILERLECFYDAVPRDRAREEVFGGLSLFARSGPGFAFYARPRLDAGAEPTAADIEAVRARQRELGLPETFEWVHETTPALLPLAEAAGLSVLRAPLLVLKELIEPPQRGRILDPGDPSYADDVAACNAIAELGFGEPGTAVGTAGPQEVKARLTPVPLVELEARIARFEAGLSVGAVGCSTLDGPVACGQYQRVDDVAEIVGVATLPSARRRGLGAAVTATLARHALDHGVELVFLSAGSDDIARVYESVGFHRVGMACIASAPPQL